MCREGGEHSAKGREEAQRRSKEGRDSHNIRHALATGALAVLERTTELGVENLEDPAVSVLVNKGPVKVEDDKVLGHCD